MSVETILNNAGAIMDKSANEEFGRLEQALAKVAAESYYETLNKLADVNIAEQTAAREEPKAYEAVIGNAMQILSENEMKPGEVVQSGIKQPVAAGGQKTAAEFLALINHIKTAASDVSAQRDPNEKVACFVCEATGCGYCGMTGGVKLAEAEADFAEAEVSATEKAAEALAAWVEASLANEEFQKVAESMDQAAVMEQMGQAQAATDAQFEQLYFNNPSVGVPDYGGKTEEFNPLLNDLLKLNRTNALQGQLK